MPKLSDEMTNQDRAELAGAAVAEYMLQGEYFQPHASGVLGDLLGDLRHWAKREEVDFEVCDRNAKACFEAEVREELFESDPLAATLLAESEENAMPHAMLARELEARFPWLLTDEQANGGDVVEALSEWHAELVEPGDDRECTCDDRSWHGDEHDSACDFAGEERS
jgi:hypothetical protein